MSSKGKSILTILVVAMLGVGLACAGEKATPTSPPTATLAPTATTAPTATLAPTPTATLPPGQATPTATSTPVPSPTPGEGLSDLTRLPGYDPAWGEPVRGGILRLGMPQSPPSFGPTMGGGINGPQDGPTYNALVRNDPWVGSSSLIGDLAKAWEVGDDGSITFKLKEGVRFQDNPLVPADIRGDEFTCEDVQASVDNLINPPEVEKRSPSADHAHVTGVSCPDGPQGYTAVITVNQVLAKTLASFFRVPMLDKDWLQWFRVEHPAGLRSVANYAFGYGTGPFVPIEYQPDVVSKARRNPSYFREGLPLVDGMDHFILKDYTTRFTALATGQIHWFGSGSASLLPGQVLQAKRDFPDRIDLHSISYNMALGTWFNMNRAPFNDRRVRKAMQLAIDRDEWLLFKSAGDMPMSKLVGRLPPYPDYYFGTPEEELRTWPGIRQPKDEDIAEANSLLDEVFGKGKRFNTTCLTRNTQAYMDSCLFFGDQVRQKLGIGSTMQAYEIAAVSERDGVCNFDVEGYTMTNTRGDPDDTIIKFSSLYPHGSKTLCQLEGMMAAEPELQAELEDMIAAQTGELDIAKRVEMVRAIDKKLTLEMIEDVHFGWLIIVYGTTPKMKGYTLVVSPQNNYGIFERTWLAK